MTGSALPTPERLYLYDDIPYIRPSLDAAAGPLLDELAATLRAEPNVIVVDVEEQISNLSGRWEGGPFAQTLALGTAGRRVADRLHERTGWFPSIQVVEITREEIADGAYRVRSAGATTLEAQVSSMMATPLAIVDDTVYSGATMLAVLERLPTETLEQAHVFCLQGLEHALKRIRELCPVEAGLEISGEADTEVSVIKASHLFEPGAIRPAHGPELAFYQRPGWIRAWFPRCPEAILDLCGALHRLLQSA